MIVITSRRVRWGLRGSLWGVKGVDIKVRERVQVMLMMMMRIWMMIRRSHKMKLQIYLVRMR